MNKRECLYELAELKLDGLLQKFTGVQLDEYWDKLHLFIDQYPLLETEMRNDLKVQKYKEFFSALSSLRDLLADIRADDMAQEIQTQISTYTKLENVRHDKLEAFMSYFLTTVSILSIDIQRVELISLEETEGKNKPTVEVHKKSDNQKTILAVDDNAVHLNALRAHLKDAPYKLMCLSSGEDALRYIEKKQPDLFILDIMMPGMDGIELAEKLKESGQTASIIFLTGSSSRDVVLRAVKAGASDFIVKPAIKDNVLAKIEKFI
ncbi:MAG: response regulator [Oscillospiraceae bacterium]|jgi:CheY-like chemotaxis protein|nr:response regulator [Oscillospiraceae bacterium]